MIQGALYIFCCRKGTTSRAQKWALSNTRKQSTLSEKYRHALTKQEILLGKSAQTESKRAVG